MSHHLEKWLTKKRGLWTEGILPLTHSPSSLVDLNLWRRDSLNLCRDTKVLNDAITRWEVKLLTNYQNHWASLHLPANLWTSKHKIHCCNKLSLFHIVAILHIIWYLKGWKSENSTVTQWLEFLMVVTYHFLWIA